MSHMFRVVQPQRALKVEEPPAISTDMLDVGILVIDSAEAVDTKARTWARRASPDLPESFCLAVAWHLPSQPEKYICVDVYMPLQTAGTS